MDIKTVGVVGAGTMGNGIAHVFARHGFSVVLCDVERSLLDRALDAIGKNLDREVEKNRLTAQDRAATLSRIEPAVERALLARCDFLVEAASEKIDVKGRALSRVRRSLPPRCNPGLKHVFHFDHQAGRPDAPPRAGDRHAFL